MFEPSIAGNRFGLGLRPGDRVGADPKAWLKSQISRYRPDAPAFARLASRAEIAGDLDEYLDEARGLKAEKRQREGTPPKADDNNDPARAARKFVAKAGRDHYAGAVGARFKAALASEAPFIERLVHFWSNHFAVSADKLTVVGLAGFLEIEAIRPHVLGRFGDMLMAVEQHPAMLLYLDQAQSIGPNSMLGERVAARGKRKIGLNENLAREILELHTLGVRTGYDQADVTEFARALTGWSVNGLARGPVARAIGLDGKPGDFAFAGAIHEPGERKMMGKRYRQQGFAQASAILADLAAHPATARHIAAKLARHFAADDPPEALIKRLEQRYLATQGNLSALYEVLIEAPEVWTGAAKFKTPWEWLVSSYRATGASPPEDVAVVGALNQLGQPVWRPKSPAGYDDIGASWAGPDALFRRVEVAERLSAKAPSGLDPRQLAAAILPGQFSGTTEQAISRAESPAQGLSLLLVSPEFLRR